MSDELINEIVSISENRVSEDVQDADQAVNGRKVEKKGGKRIGFNYIILKSLKESQKNDVVKCLYIKSITRFGFCVIKEGTYGDTRDKLGRDIKDRLIWQEKLHKELGGILPLPKFLGSFEENGNYYLVIEHINGRSLYNELKKYKKEILNSFRKGGTIGLRFLQYLWEVASLLELLHQRAYVHRDVTPSNFIISRFGKVFVIDLELSYSLDHTLASPFLLGTDGYMSPEQKGQQAPAIEQDVFSFGAILAEILCTIHPVKITEGPFNELPEKIRFLIRDEIMAELVINCLRPEPWLRPDISTIRSILKTYIHDLKKGVNRATSKCNVYFNKDRITADIQQAIAGLSTPLFYDTQKGWFTESLKEKPNKDHNRINKAWYASFNKGVSGILYFLCKAHEQGFDITSQTGSIQKGFQLIEERYIDKLDQAKTGLYFGADGVAATIAAAMQAGVWTDHNKGRQWIDQLLGHKTTVLNAQMGIAGQGIALLNCLPFEGQNRLGDLCKSYANQLISQQETDGSWSREIPGEKSRKTKGFANGIAGIAWFLLAYSQRFNDEVSKNAALNGLEWLIRKAVGHGKTVLWKTDGGTALSYGWQEGSAGIALSFLKAFELTQGDAYKAMATKILSQPDPAIMDSNLSQVNGLCGLGEVYLSAYTTLKDEEWLSRADWLVQLMMHLKKSHPEHGSFWLIGNEKHPTADFMSGNTGLLHYLLRYKDPFATGFPLLG